MIARKTKFYKNRYSDIFRRVWGVSPPPLHKNVWYSKLCKRCMNPYRPISGALGANLITQPSVQSVHIQVSFNSKQPVPVYQQGTGFTMRDGRKQLSGSQYAKLREGKELKNMWERRQRLILECMETRVSKKYTLIWRQLFKITILLWKNKRGRKR